MAESGGVCRTELPISHAAALKLTKFIAPQKSAIVIWLSLVVAILVGCDTIRPFQAVATPIPDVVGQLLPWDSGSPVSGRHIAFCRSIDESKTGSCVLMEPAVISDENGVFQMSGLPAGIYFLLYDSGLSDFDAAFDRWRGETLHLGNQDWMSQLLGIDLSREWVEVHLPEGMHMSVHAEWFTAYCTATLLVGNSPFIVAHDMEAARDKKELHCLQLDITPGQTKEVEIQVAYFGDQS